MGAFMIYLTIVTEFGKYRARLSNKTPLFDLFRAAEEWLKVNVSGESIVLIVKIEI
jgi:hypothetical protein